MLQSGQVCTDRFSRPRPRPHGPKCRRKDRPVVAALADVFLIFCLFSVGFIALPDKMVKDFK
jgi:hypothetical protein